MIARYWKAPILLGAIVSPLFLAACSQTTSHGMSVANLTDSIKPASWDRARPYRYNARDKECLERAMFFESNRSSRAGMVAVGTVVMNRLKSGQHGDSICSVVGEPRQFAPGVMTRAMNSKAMPDVQEAAEAVLKGERAPKLKNAMHFHTAGLKFPYKNMHYVLVAGGNAFYEKRTRNWKPLPPDSDFQIAAANPAAEQTLSSTPQELQPPPVMVASAAAQPLPQARPSVTDFQQPNSARFGTVASQPEQVMTASVDRPSSDPVMSFQSTPDDTSAIGALILNDSRPLDE